MRNIALFVFLMLAAVVPAGPANGQARDPVTVDVRDQRASPGGTVQIQGEGWKPGSRLRVFIEDQDVGTTTVGDEGRFATDVTIPGDASTGDAEVRVVGLDDEGQRTTLRASVSITEEGTPGTVTILVVAGLILLAVLILAAILLSRRRRAGESLEGASTQEPMPFDAGRRTGPP